MSAKDSNKILAFSCALFVFLGISSSAIGLLLPELATNAETSLTAIGAVFTATFLGSIITQTVLGAVCDRFGQRPVLLAGLGMITIGLSGFVFKQSQWVILGFAFIYGLGMGAVVLGNNLLIARVFAKRSVSTLNLTNFFFGVGAILGPMAVSLSMTLTGSGLPVIGLDALAYFILIPLGIQINAPPSAASQSVDVANNRMDLLRSPLIWFLGIIILLYVGIEQAMGGWIATYIKNTTLLSLETSALVTSGYWFTFTIGRLVNAWLGIHLTPQRILVTCLGLSLSGGLLYALTSGLVVPTIIGVLVIGFSFGAIYPTVIALTTSVFYSSPGLAVSIVGSLGSVGGLFIPFSMGYMIENTGPASSAWFAVIVIALICTFYILAQQSIRQSTQPVPSVSNG